MGTTSDVIVVGGGINGASIAFNLARRGIKVTLVEKDHIAAGPTGRSCAIIRQHYSHQITARMALRALRIFQNFDDIVGGECEFRQTGFVLAARTEDVEALKANVALQRSVGIDTRILSPQELHELEPHASLEGIAAAAYEPESGYADPYSTASAYVNRAIELGAELRTRTRVLSVMVEGSKATGVITDEGRLRAGVVVVAAGPWTPRLTRQCGIELPLTPCRVQVCLFDRAPEIEHHSILIDAAFGIYVRPESGTLMLVGSVETEEAEHRVDDPDEFNQAADFDTVAHYSEQLTRRYPAMSSGSYHNGYASLYDVSPDWHPILDELPGVDNLYCCAGSSGHGFKLAPVVGEMMAGLVINGKGPGDEIEMFGFSRFMEGNLANGKYPHKILG
ncbi:MAG: NAD(P)/FAD-dependent oxidoreductase [Acidobacteriota bacterium]